MHPLHKDYGPPHPQWSPPALILLVPWVTLPEVCPLSLFTASGTRAERASEPCEGSQWATWPGLYGTSILPPGAASTGRFLLKGSPRAEFGKHGLVSPVGGLSQCSPGTSSASGREEIG